MTNPTPSRPTRQARIEGLYNRLPGALQTAVLNVEAWRVRRERLGGGFRQRLDEYLRLERASDDEVLAVRRERLRQLLVFATREIPYWRDTFRAAGLDPARVEGPEDLAPLPILTKDDVVRLGPALWWAGAPARSIRTVHTSGTTGAGMIFRTTIDAVRDQWAIWWRYRLRHGIDFRTWSAVFGGRPIVAPDRRDPPYWRVNYPNRQLFFSQYHLSPATAGLYLEELGRRNLPWFHGYPSVLAYLSSLALDSGHTARPTPRVVTLGAENVLPAQARSIREAFGAEPIQHYGQAEAVANASQCPAGRLHIDEEFAAVELVPGEDGAYRMLGTCLENRATPLIRYDTGDLARPLAGRCACGLPGRAIESIDGRQEDLITLSDGSRVGRLDHLFKDLTRVAEAQIRQDRPGRCVIAVVPRAGYDRADEETLVRECRQRFGDRLVVEIEIVDSIPRTRSGKLRLVVAGNAAR